MRAATRNPLCPVLPQDSQTCSILQSLCPLAYSQTREGNSTLSSPGSKENSLFFERVLLCNPRLALNSQSSYCRFLRDGITTMVPRHPALYFFDDEQYSPFDRNETHLNSGKHDNLADCWARTGRSGEMNQQMWARCFQQQLEAQISWLQSK